MMQYVGYNFIRIYRKGNKIIKCKTFSELQPYYISFSMAHIAKFPLAKLSTCLVCMLGIHRDYAHFHVHSASLMSVCAVLAHNSYFYFVWGATHCGCSCCCWWWCAFFFCLFIQYVNTGSILEITLANIFRNTAWRWGNKTMFIAIALWWQTHTGNMNKHNKIRRGTCINNMQKKWHEMSILYWRWG